MDEYSDPFADNGYSADDEISKGLSHRSLPPQALLDDTRPLADLDPTRVRHVVFLVGGQGPMQTFRHNAAVEAVVRDFHDVGKPTVVVCHATCVLLDVDRRRREVDRRRQTLDRLHRGRGTVCRERRSVGRIQPFWIETEAERIADTTFVAGPPMESHAIVDGNLVTGQQQHSGAEAAGLAIGLSA